jgi:hypothetical protein
VSRRTIERIAALASSVVASMPMRLPCKQAAIGKQAKHPGKHLLCVSTSISRRVREIVE